MQQLHPSPPATSLSPSRFAVIGQDILTYCLKYVGVFLTGLFFYACCGYIFLQVDPEVIQHTWLTNSFAPLLLLSALGHWGVFTFLLGHFRRGALVSAVLTISLFLRLHNVFNQNIFLGLLMCTVGIELFSLISTFYWQRWKIQRQHSSRQQVTDTITPISTSTSPSQSTNGESQSPQTRRRGRRRQHHFFGQ